MTHHKGQFPPHGFRFKSGGGAASTPILPAPPAPAATETSLEVVQAKQAARQAAKSKQGIQSTILSDALGNDASQLRAAAPKGNTLLGGG